MAKATVKHLTLKRYLTYWSAVAIGYVFPFVYFFITAGVKRQATKWVMPTLIAGIFLVIKLARDIPKWTKSWKPSFAKGLLVASPKILLFIILITIGVVLKWIVTKQVETSFYTYFETVIVLFGGQSGGAVLEAFHLKYYQLHLIDKGYVLGVVNK